MESVIANCKSCGEVLNGSFCGACGQKVITDRYTLKKIFNDLIANIFNLEKGFFFTTQKLFTHPELVIGGYLSGQTRKYYNPIRFFLIWISLQVLIVLSFNIFDEQYTQVGDIYERLGILNTETDKIRMAKTMEIVKKFLTIIPLALIPFYSFLSYKIYKSKKLYYAEHCILNVYVIGMATIVGLVTVILYVIFPDLIAYSMMVGIITFVLFYTYVYNRFFKSDWLESVLYAFITVVGGYLLFIVTLFTAGIILGILIALVILLFKKLLG